MLIVLPKEADNIIIIIIIIIIGWVVIINITMGGVTIDH